MSAVEAVAELRGALGDAVSTDQRAIARVLKDASWLSPVLSEQIDRRAEESGPVMGVHAVVRPRSEAEVLRVAAIVARHRVPLTARGAGTTGFGLVTPEQGGIVLDTRSLDAHCAVVDGGVRASAGMLQGEMERVAREAGRELSVLVTTYASATVAGWIAGGHVGLGSGSYGSVWDGNVLGVRVASVTEEPAIHELAGAEADPLLHTFGTVGIVTEVTVRTTPAREWIEAVGRFETFAQATAFTTALAHDPSIHERAVTAQEEALMPAFGPVAELVGPRAGVLMIVDAAQLDEVRAVAARFGGQVVEWQHWRQGRNERPSLAAMVYGHRMLWVVREFPDAAFAHLYPDPDDPGRDIARLKERFGDDLLFEVKYVRSPWMRRALGLEPAGVLVASVVVLRDARPERVRELLAFCDAAGIRYMNSHTNVIEDTGLFGDVEPIVRMKAELDPYGLLNPGRLRSAVVQA
jgi:FAD/FMN-containing dehydrogenase